eukprot:CAMPEP_0174704870 /NCGR_PEP_ID=MMETSP1094-20130205/8296_1 /TAXON_ID=156173 /ORGANISM="Chrysochromulina brevifilum, Strain UTEX LB 985" /LENGTH=41 /DNA_ID= /DNA_START= /DNA_END= /DNA_ORIENTATION=
MYTSQGLCLGQQGGGSTARTSPGISWTWLGMKQQFALRSPV